VSAFSALVVVSAIFGLVWPVVRRNSPARRIPWWWWLAIGVSAVVLGYANGED